MKQWRELKILFPYFKPYRLRVIFAFITSFLFVITNVAIPYLAGMITTQIVTQLSHHQPINFEQVAFKITIFLICCLFNIIFQYGASALMTVAIQNAMQDLRQDIANKLDRLPMKYIDGEKKGDLLSRLTNDVDVINNACQQGIMSAFNALLSVVFAIGMMIYLNIWLTIAALVMVPMIYGFTRYIIKRSQPHFEGQQQALGEVNGFIQEQLEGFDVVKLYGQEDATIAQFKSLNDKLGQHLFQAGRISGLLMPLMNLSAYTGYLFVAIIGSVFCLHGQLQVGQLQAFIQYIWQVSQPLSQMSQLSNILQGALAGIHRIHDLLSQQDMHDVPTTQTPSVTNGEVAFEHVDFSYTTQPLIEDFNLHVQPGETIAIVGPTGAGKTTLVNLLMRFYDIQKGVLRLDGISSENMSKHDWRNHFGMVLQDAWLIEGTIMDNLRFASLDATDDELIAIAKQCHIHDEIMSLPHGYETKLEAGGNPLSQGQKQLLTIARAIVKNPEILILDEATSSVDTRLERKIQQAMDEVMNHRTSFVIAHRLSTIRHADHILVLEHGHIVEKGNHETLLKKNGAYAALYRSQFSKTSNKDYNKELTTKKEEQHESVIV